MVDHGGLGNVLVYGRDMRQWNSDDGPQREDAVDPCEVGLECIVVDLDRGDFTSADDFSEERDELTPTLKPRRRVIRDHYHAIIDEMYAVATAAHPRQHAGS